MRINRLGIALGFKEVVVGTYRVNVGTGLIAAVGEGNCKRRFSQAIQELFRFGVVIGGIDAVHHQSVHVATLHLRHQIGHGNVIATSLQRRTGNIDGLAKIPQRSIQSVDHYLDRAVIQPAHYQ